MGKLSSRTTGKRPLYQLKELNDKHKEITRRLSLGQSNKHIAAELGVTPQTVTIVKGSVLADDRMDNLHGRRDTEFIEINEHIRKTAIDSVNTLRDIMLGCGGAKASDRVNAAKDLLDRAGFGAVQKSANVNTNVSLSQADIDRMKSEAMGAGMVIPG